MTLIQNLRNYLNDIFRQDFFIEALPDNAMHGLPLYLSQAYAPYRLTLFGRDLILLGSIGEEPGTPGQIAKDLVRLRQKLGSDVVLVVSELASWERQRFIEQGIAFIVPGRQMFLPMLLIDLREHFPSSTKLGTAPLSWASQLALLRQILFADIANKNFGELASLLGYSAMTITQIRNEITTLGLCEEVIQGRSRLLDFSLSAQDLWNRARPYLRSPVIKKHFVTGAFKNPLLAGINALALRSNLQADPIPQIAVYNREWRKLLKQETLAPTKDEDTADALLEEWRYNPHLLAKDGTVDPLSLYLSLADDPDERVQIELETMMESIQW
ncbi:hypothetical protein KAI87_09495 [Myxococcota bacterium]|nr:hypothetical protein [Myxococcota bacterium]